MGMPITSYSIMNVLDRGGHGYEIDAVRKVLKPYNLFAFIIYDPEKHPDFAKEISRQFDLLDHLTDRKLLFFALVNSPEEWLRNGSSRPYYEKFDQLMRCSTKDKDITALLLAESLRIPYEKLPCLVISPNFRLKNFTWLRTCKSHVVEQLSRLGYIARYIPKNFRFDSLDKKIKALDLCEGSGSVSLENTLARALADVLSFMTGRGPTLGAEKRLQGTLKEAYNKLNNLKSKREQANDDEDRAKLDNELENLSQQISMALAHLNDKDLDLATFVNIEEEYLEDDSYIMLKTAHRVLDTLIGPRQPTGRARSKVAPKFDFTPPVICLAKVFEREINLSIVHWIRESLGIELPCYFNRFRPGLPAGYTTFDRVNFNRGDHASGNWYPPEIGRSRNALEALATEPSMYANLSRNWIKLLKEPPLKKTLFDNWEVIRTERNIAAHNRVVAQKSVTAVQDALNNLSENGIFRVLHEMKNTYSGKGPGR